MHSTRSASELVEEVSMSVLLRKVAQAMFTDINTREESYSISGQAIELKIDTMCTVSGTC
jgi:hypothetical protein